MKFSRWCHVLYNGDNVALVHSIYMNVVYMEKNIYESIRLKLDVGDMVDQDDFMVELQQARLIVEDDFDDLNLLKQTRESLESSISLELLYLLVTDGCNLKCTYCFEETPSIDQPFRSVMMSDDTVYKSLDLFAQLSSLYGDPGKKKVIHLYGGEPLVNRRAVYCAIQYVDHLKKNGSLPKDCQVTIVTNGVLLNEKDADFFARHSVTVGLSIDGPALITNKFRVPKRADIDVMESITNAFRLLKKAGVSVGLSVTLTAEAVRNENEMIEFFTRSEFRCADGVSFNLLHYTPAIDTSDSYYRAAVAFQIMAFKVFRKGGIYEERVMRKVRAFVDQAVMYADCGAVGYQLVVAPDGKIGPCQDFIKPRTYFSRSVYDSNTDGLLEEVFAGWRKRSPLYMDQCTDCIALGICGGGCPASAELRTGNRFGIDERACHHSTSLIQWLVWDAYTLIDKGK